MLLGVSVGDYAIEVSKIAGVFLALEFLFPAIRRPRSKRAFFTDLGYWIAKPWVTTAAVGAVGIIGVFVISRFVTAPEGSSMTWYLNRHTPIGNQALWLQTIEVAFCLDFFGYWGHRWSHRARLLWRFHSLHHSASDVTWTTTERIHPLDNLWMKLWYGLPVLFLGFNMSGFFLGGTVLGFYAVLTHANVPWSFGPLKYVIVTPLSHRWHHTSAEEGLDKNFAVGFVWFDMLFGTFYLPKGRQPTVFGTKGEAIPENYLGQLLWPFHRRQRQPVPTLVAPETSAA